MKTKYLSTLLVALLTLPGSWLQAKVVVEFAYPYSQLFDVTYEKILPKFYEAHPNIELPDAPEGYVRVHETNQHLYSRAKIGKITKDGQFEVMAVSEDLIEPDPFPKGYQ